MSDTCVVETDGGYSRTQWYLNRLQCMSPQEVLHRAGRAVVVRAEAGGLRLWRVPAAALSDAGVNFIAKPATLDERRYIDAADRIVDGKLDIFALHDIDMGTPPRWNRDPKTGIEAPLTFGKLLNYRDPQIVGDIKYLWEPNRHLHLVTLAQAYAITGDAKYTDCIRLHLDSWLHDCPWRLGPNWASGLELAMRLINWSVTWQLIGGVDAAMFGDDDGTAFRARWIESVYQHAHFIRGHYSRHSSANNHLIGEAAGLYIACRTWPFWRDMRRWERRATAILEREICLQNGKDGVNREQAISYQQFDFDLFLMCWLAGGNAGFSSNYLDCMERMLDYIASVMDVAGNVPMIGDSDDGYVVRLSQEEDFCRYRSVLATGAVMYGRRDFQRKARVADDKTRWLFGRAADEAFRTAPDGQVAKPRREFPVGGYYILGTALETDREIRLLADAGPLGYSAIAAHGHADALSFTLSVGGREILIDPGTYAYHADDVWRQYFRGTSAHNTLRVDGRNQSQAGGNFMWLKKARAGCSVWVTNDNYDEFEGWHDGYQRLHDPVLHTRRIVLHKAARRIDIEDRLQMTGRHDIELFFHLNERCNVDAAAAGFNLQWDDQRLQMTLPRLAGSSARVYRGSRQPLCGWLSRNYDELRSSPTIVWRAAITGDAVLRTSVQC